MTTYAKKIAEAVRDSAADYCESQPLYAAPDVADSIRALDLDAIIAGVPGPELCADEQWQAEEAARKEFPSDMDWTNPANLGATAVERNAFRRGWTAAKHNALTQPQAAEPVDDCSASLPFAILHDEMAALKRFDECVTDGEGYDVPKEMMKRLSEIGLVRRVTANVYEHTNFGLSVLNGDFAPQPQTAQQPSQPAASESARDAKDAALQAINDIRNSIIGLQTLNWSEHVYPLVVALDKAGYKGMSYPKARKFYGTMLDRCNRAEADTKRLDFLCDHVVNVRDPLPHGSHDMFWASPTDDDSGHAPSNLRALIDSEIERLDRAEGE